MAPPSERNPGTTRSIEVDEQVWQHIQRHTTGPADRPGDVLRRLLRLPDNTGGSTPAAPAPAPLLESFATYARAAGYALVAEAAEQDRTRATGPEAPGRESAGEAKPDLAGRLASAAERGLASFTGHAAPVPPEAALRAARLAAYFAARAVTSVHSPLDADGIAHGLGQLMALPARRRVRALERAAQSALALTHHEPPRNTPE